MAAISAGVLEIILEIPRVPSSPNYLRGKHWRVRWRETKLWNEEVGLAILQARHQDPPYPLAQVTIDRRSRGELDPDNLVGSVKPVIDALRHAAILVNDSPDHIKLTITQSRGDPLTRIEIQPL